MTDILPGRCVQCQSPTENGSSLCGECLGQRIDVFDAPEVEPRHSATPVMAREAFTGLAGDVVEAISPFTEAADAAILADYLLTFGCQIPWGPFVMQGGTRQDTREQFLIVGSSSTARKASSRIFMKRLYRNIPGNARICEGVGSAEALLEEFEDIEWSTDNPPKVLHGYEDKRLLFYQSEFAQVMIIASRAGSTMTALLRDIWDKERIEYKTVSSRHRVASNFTVGLMGNVTGEELMSLMQDRYITNGFANRILYIWAERSKLIPFGPSLAVVDETLRQLASPIHAALCEARKRTEISWSDDAKTWWMENYERLSTIDEGGRIGSLISRRHTHIVRLALLYCLQASRGQLELSDLQAAFAVWQYSEDTVRYVVNRYYAPEEDRRGVAQARSDLTRGRGAKLLKIVNESPGCTRTEIRRSFSNNIAADELDRMVYMMSDLIEVRGKDPARFWPRASA